MVDAADRAVEQFAVRVAQRSHDRAPRQREPSAQTEQHRRYERERRSENALAARGLDTIERVFSLDNSLAATLRGFALAGADRVQLAKQFFMSAAAGRL